MPEKRSNRDRSLLGALYPTLDLHGDTASEARARAERWIATRQSEGEPIVRLITGRGLHSAGPAVLPGEIEDLLRSLRGSLVRRFEREPGGGVIRVELSPMKPLPAPRLRPGSSRGAPGNPQLRRQAEESLAELGITPTPELLRAEMERIQKESGGVP